MVTIVEFLLELPVAIYTARKATVAERDQLSVL